MGLLIQNIDRNRESPGPSLPFSNTEEACPTEHEKNDMPDIRNCLNGDGEAYARLMERHQERVARRMWRFTRDGVEHCELVQEVFVQAYISLASYKGRAPFAHWLAKISTTVGYRFWKKRTLNRSRSTVPIEEWSEQLAAHEADALEPSQAADLLHAFLQKLPPRDRLVLMLRHVEDRSVEETAALTGWTESMVKVQAWRARRKLKKLFQEAGLEVD